MTASTQLDPRVKSELARALVKGSTVFLLGGEAALDARVADEIARLGFEPKRLAGENRFATATAIAEEGLNAPDTVLVATGDEFADAVTAGAAAAHREGAVLLSAGRELPLATSDYLERHTPTRQFAVGGPAAAAAPQATEVVGTTRFETAVAVAGTFFVAPSTVGVATGSPFPDSLAGGAHAAQQNAPILLTAREQLHPAVREYLAGDSGAPRTGVIYGGPAALAPAVADQLAADLDGQ